MIITLSARLSAESNPQLEFYFDDEKTGGMRLTTSFADLRFTTRPTKQNFGAAVFTSNLTPRLPLTVKAGNLSAGGALSTLNSPELSSGSSPFTTSISATSPLTAALPGYSSFSKPVSAFLEFSTPPSQSPRTHTQSATGLPFTLKLNTWFTDQSSTPVSSILLTLPTPNKHINLSASYTGGFFYYNTNATSSWFLKSPYYPSSKHYCGLFQFSSEIKPSSTKTIKAITTNLTTALYESPFGFYQLIYRADTKLSTKHTQTFAQIYYNPYDQLLTSSGKTLNPNLQFKTGILYKSPSKVASLYFKTPVFLKAGTNTILKINLPQTEHPLKLNAGLQFSTTKTTQSLSLSTDCTLLTKSPLTPPEDLIIKTLTPQLKSTITLGPFTPSITLTATLPQTPDSQKKYKLTATTTYTPKTKTTQLKLTATTTLSITPNSQIETNLTSSLAIHLKIKYLTFIGKLAFNEDLQ